MAAQAAPGGRFRSLSRDRRAPGADPGGSARPLLRAGHFRALAEGDGPGAARRDSGRVGHDARRVGTLRGRLRQHQGDRQRGRARLRRQARSDSRSRRREPSDQAGDEPGRPALDQGRAHRRSRGGGQAAQPERHRPQAGGEAGAPAGQPRRPAPRHRRHRRGGAERPRSVPRRHAPGHSGLGLRRARHGRRRDRPRLARSAAPNRRRERQADDRPVRPADRGTRAGGRSGEDAREVGVRRRARPEDGRHSRARRLSDDPVRRHQTLRQPAGSVPGRGGRYVRARLRLQDLHDGRGARRRGGPTRDDDHGRRHLPVRRRHDSERPDTFRRTLPR